MPLQLQAYPSPTHVLRMFGSRREEKAPPRGCPCTASRSLARIHPPSHSLPLDFDPVFSPSPTSKHTAMADDPWADPPPASIPTIPAPTPFGSDEPGWGASPAQEAFADAPSEEAAPAVEPPAPATAAAAADEETAAMPAAADESQDDFGDFDDDAEVGAPGDDDFGDFDAAPIEPEAQAPVVQAPVAQVQQSSGTAQWVSRLGVKGAMRKALTPRRTHRRHCKSRRRAHQLAWQSKYEHCCLHRYRESKVCIRITTEQPRAWAASGYARASRYAAKAGELQRMQPASLLSVLIPLSHTRSQNMWATLSTQPTLRPTDYQRSYTRRSHLIALGVPINLEEFAAPAVRARVMPPLALTLDGVKPTAGPLSAPGGASRASADGRLASKPGSRAASPAPQRNERMAERRREELGLGAPPEVDMARAQELVDLTESELSCRLPVLSSLAADASTHPQITSRFSLCLTCAPCRPSSPR